ncbi:MAG: Rieske 2Fe-2S domain-containing protein [Pirellulales bacterium]|nr:Rieske 2Fe-2S domain-containing protein [Pirellulales bacterium]
MSNSPASQPHTPTPAAATARRSFFRRLLALAVGGLITLVPGAAGLLAFLDPLFRRGGRARQVPVAPLAAIPDDGVPRQFPVVADRQDAWNSFPAQPIGAVFLRRTPGSEEVLALNATCPHAGCMVAYQPAAESFRCPCHTSRFKADGTRILPCVSPRDLDRLECEVRDGVVWVSYQDFYTGKAQKIARQ